jgi:hypothetical protein
MSYREENGQVREKLIAADWGKDAAKVRRRVDWLLGWGRGYDARSTASSDADREYLRAAMMKHFSDKLSMEEIGNFIYEVVPTLADAHTDGGQGPRIAPPEERNP